MDRDSGKASFRISCYMLELYCDDLADLLSEHKRGDRMVSEGCGGAWEGVARAGPKCSMAGLAATRLLRAATWGAGSAVHTGCRVTVH